MVYRIALSSHDSVGLGHVRRNLAISHALTRMLPDLLGQEVTGVLVTGQASATAFPAPAGWDWVVVPSVSVDESGYRSRHLATDIERVTAMRAGAVTGVLRAFAPDLFIVDRHPFGVHGELRDALRELRAVHPSCATVLGLRDVLDRPAAARAEFRALGGARAVREHFDAVWVYGDPGVHDLRTSGETPPGLAPLISYTGYLAHGRPTGPPPAADGPFVLTTVGGGSDGVEVAVAAAAATVPHGHRHLVVTGPQMSPADRDRVRRAATDPSVEVVESVPHLPALLERAAAVVTMGGYNTVCEVLHTSTPALVVPRCGRRDEQRIRARALEQKGVIETVDADRLDDRAVTEFFRRTHLTRCPREGVQLDGIAETAALAAQLIAPSTRGVTAHAV
ncbi:MULTISPECIES: glycosyltransferase family protein [Microbacterium]|uniref:glycosyltransferase family protein n=1 Tax=Microbacterium TaxID=33882 RepID=UPI00278424FE|nr:MULTISPECIES: glycosyltransferase [Microbacterium]MDQ1082188.1 putative glycosyltransferase [Microbacterium sp. SORGH_AS_0344]MDQ1169041.1 putative glycosyltransferase [Microbacterium proteolyticum]